MSEMPAWYADYKAEVERLMALATQGPVPLSRDNTRCDGPYKWPDWRWQGMRWSEAFIDLGPSVAGNPGPYLKVPYYESPDDADYDTRHRIYPWPRRLIGRVRFEQTGEGETGWVMWLPAKRTKVKS